VLSDALEYMPEVDVRIDIAESTVANEDVEAAAVSSPASDPAKR